MNIIKKHSLLLCTALGVIISPFEGVAGGAIIAVSLFLADKGVDLSVELTLWILCASSAMLFLAVFAGLGSLLISIMIASATFGAVYTVLKVMKEFGKEEGK